MQIARETTHLVQTYTLPDGRHIRVAAERFMAPEVLFTPDLIDREGDGISSMVFKCIQVGFIASWTLSRCPYEMNLSRHNVCRFAFVCFILGVQSSIMSFKGHFFSQNYS